MKPGHLGRWPLTLCPLVLEVRVKGATGRHFPINHFALLCPVLVVGRVPGLLEGELRECAVRCVRGGLSQRSGHRSCTVHRWKPSTLFSPCSSGLKVRSKDV